MESLLLRDIVATLWPVLYVCVSRVEESNLVLHREKDGVSCCF